MFRLALLSAAAVMVLPPMSVKAADIEAQYVGGTRATIPANTVGALNLDDSKELRFSYGAAVYRVPYAQITSSDIRKVDDVHRLFGRVPVPSITPWKRKQTLSISFKDATDTPGTLNFQVLSKDATLAAALLSARKDLKQSATAQPTGAPDNSWWGDKYWRTTRNQAKWDAATAKPADDPQAPQTASATAPAAAPVTAPAAAPTK
jgi:hypothetical protein